MSRTTPSSKPQTQSSRPQRKSRRATTGREGESLLLVVRRSNKKAIIVDDHEDVGGVGDGHGVEKQRTKTGRRNHAPGGQVIEGLRIATLKQTDWQGIPDDGSEDGAGDGGCGQETCGDKEAPGGVDVVWNGV